MLTLPRLALTFLTSGENLTASHDVELGDESGLFLVFRTLLYSLASFNVRSKMLMASTLHFSNFALLSSSCLRSQVPQDLGELFVFFFEVRT
jgi:hypothetical protein